MKWEKSYENPAYSKDCLGFYLSRDRLYNQQVTVEDSKTAIAVWKLSAVILEWFYNDWNSSVKHPEVSHECQISQVCFFKDFYWRNDIRHYVDPEKVLVKLI